MHHNLPETRRSTNFSATLQSGKKLTIRALLTRVTPRQKTWHGTKARELFHSLTGMSERNFDESIVFELGVGVFQK